MKNLLKSRWFAVCILPVVSCVAVWFFPGSNSPSLFVKAVLASLAVVVAAFGLAVEVIEGLEEEQQTIADLATHKKRLPHALLTSKWTRIPTYLVFSFIAMGDRRAFEVQAVSDSQEKNQEISRIRKRAKVAVRAITYVVAIVAVVVAIYS